ncbi:MAG TPA: alpha/beta fold hydrolase [Myxococcales bacterium]|nr:alpha/beta fold hydrolase [Myxococcales bacterium]
MDVIFPALDHVPLAGTLTEARGPLRGAVLIASAMGVPRGFYGAFADYLAEAGLTVLRFDYRGIGGSLRGPIAQSDATMHAWGEQDLAGALGFLRDRHAGIPLLLVGHSAGGQLFGLVPEPNQVQAMLTVGAQSGYWRNWKGFGRLRMLFYWTVLFPALTHALGHLPLRRLTGGGENVPPGVALEWSSWGRDPAYVLSYARRKNGAKGYAAFTGRIRAYALADDAYAPRAAVQALLDFYPEASRELLYVRPSSLGASSIGHFGFFQRRFRDSLWSEARNWLLSQASSQAAA